VNKIKIGFWPYDLNVNAFAHLNRSILERLGNVVEVPGTKKLLKQLVTHFFETGNLILYDILIINWRENLIKSKSNSLSVIGSIEFFITLLIYKLCCHKLIYVKHNIRPHNLLKKFAVVSEKMVDIGQSIADIVVVLCPAYAQLKGYYYVPHPLYITDDIPNSEIESKSYFLVFGRIERYKNIDEIIKYFDNDTELIVMGPCNDQEYLKRLEKLAQGKRIIFEIDFHSDEYLQKRIKLSRGVIITNDSSSMLVSGSFFYAISCGTRVYTLKTPFIEWVKGTSLGPYITVEPNVELLIKRMTNCVDKNNTSERSEIIKHAEFLFGDISVEKAWQKALDITRKNN
jgi:glycosyltransferase involved in cell wall biosynthesis